MVSGARWCFWLRKGTSLFRLMFLFMKTELSSSCTLYIHGARVGAVLCNMALNSVRFSSFSIELQRLRLLLVYLYLWLVNGCTSIWKFYNENIGTERSKQFTWCKSGYQVKEKERKGSWKLLPEEKLSKWAQSIAFSLLAARRKGALLWTVEFCYLGYLRVGGISHQEEQMSLCSWPLEGFDAGVFM